MRKQAGAALSALVIVGLVTVGWGQDKPTRSASAPRSGSVPVAAQSEMQSQLQGQNGFIGYVGDVVTYHYNVARQGLNALEAVLTLSNVNFNTFGKAAFFAVDGKVDAQPLYLYKMPIGPNVRNVLYVAT